MEINHIEAAIEAILFASGDAVPFERICLALEMDKKTVKLIINNMIMKYSQDDRGILLREIDKGYQLCSKPELKSYVSKVFEPRQKQGLSQAAYETLSIIAYNEPVTKAKIEKIRGVNSDSTITRLVERNLIEDAGRLDAPGRPILFKTTEEFLRSFGLKSVKDLPQIQFGMNESLNEQSDIIESEDGIVLDAEEEIAAALES